MQSRNVPGGVAGGRKIYRTQPPQSSVPPGERKGLTDIQRRQIAAAAIGLRPGARTTFINDVECHLDARCHGRSTSDADISKAIEATLDTTPFWPKSVFMCDSVSNNK
jgi:hypothetical protein